MTWDDCLALGATRLSRILGCPPTTAHSWILRAHTGKSPAGWERDIFIPIIRTHQKKTAKPNKTERTIPPAVERSAGKDSGPEMVRSAIMGGLRGLQR